MIVALDFLLAKVVGWMRRAATVTAPAGSGGPLPAEVREDAPAVPRSGWRARALLPAGIVHAAPFRATLSGRAAVAAWRGVEGERQLVILPAEPADFAAVWLLDAASRTASTIGRPLHVDALDLGLRALAPDLPPGMTWETVEVIDAHAVMDTLIAEVQP